MYIIVEPALKLNKSLHIGLYTYCSSKDREGHDIRESQESEQAHVSSGLMHGPELYP